MKITEINKIKQIKSTSDITRNICESFENCNIKNNIYNSNNYINPINSNGKYSKNINSSIEILEQQQRNAKSGSSFQQLHDKKGIEEDEEVEQYVNIFY